MTHDLAEFLTARLDEERVAAGTWHLAETRKKHLADVDAKRRIIDSYTKLREADEDLEHLTARDLHQMQTLGWVLRLLALPYADHPDYDETWRP